MSKDKLTIHESEEDLQKDLFKTHLSSNKLFSFKNLLSRINIGNIATVIAIIGGTIVVIDFINEQPKLSLTSPKVSVESIFQRDSYLKSLNLIENNYSEFTENEVNNIINYVESINPDSPDFGKNVEDIRTKITKSIEYFDNYGKKQNDKYNEIIRKLNSIKTSFINSNNISHVELSQILDDLNELEGEYYDYTYDYITEFDYITELIKLVSNLLEISPETQNYSKQINSIANKFQETIEIFESEISSSSDIPNEINKISTDLGKIKSHLEESIKGDNKKVFVELVIENRSSLKNLIHSQAMITLYDHTDIFLEENISNSISVPISTINPDITVVNDRELISLKLESKPFKLLSEDTKKSIDTAFEENYRYVVVIEDLHGRLWSLFGRIPTGFNSKSENIKLLEKESEQLILKKRPGRSFNLFCR